jgi:protein SCO1/2
MKARMLAVLGIPGLALMAMSRVGHDAELPYYTDVTLTPHFLGAGYDSASIHEVGDFTLTDQRGKRVGRATVKGRTYVASFFYTDCRTLCPDLKTQLVRVQREFASDSSVMILSHSVDPAVDTVGKLAHYASANHIDGKQWRLLTGDRAEIARLARERYFVELSDTTGNTQGRLRHTETLVLVDRDGHIRGVYDGSLAFEVSQLIRDIHELTGK